MDDYIQENLCDFGLGKEILYLTQLIKKKIIKETLSKIKYFCSLTLFKGYKKTNREKYLQITSDKDRVPKIHNSN